MKLTPLRASAPTSVSHSSLHAVQYVCPGCVTSLWVDVEPAAGKDWQDFILRS